MPGRRGGGGGLPTSSLEGPKEGGRSQGHTLVVWCSAVAIAKLHPPGPAGLDRAGVHCAGPGGLSGGGGGGEGGLDTQTQEYLQTPPTHPHPHPRDVLGGGERGGGGGEGV